MERRQPLGIELVKRGIVSEDDIKQAIEYQRSNPKRKIGDILDILGLCDPKILIEAIGDILEEKAIYLTINDVKIDILDYISLDTMKDNKVVPFEIMAGKIKVCFADTTNRRSVDKVRLLLLNKGLVMEKYITFESNIERIIDSLEGTATENINVNVKKLEDILNGDNSETDN